jgi:hypothetical protein
MTQDEIIEIASQVYGECVWHESALQRLEAFVKLIAAKEREACAKVCETKHFSHPVREVGARHCAAAIRARGEA